MHSVYEIENNRFEVIPDKLQARTQFKTNENGEVTTERN